MTKPKTAEEIAIGLFLLFDKTKVFPTIQLREALEEYRAEGIREALINNIDGDIESSRMLARQARAEGRREGLEQAAQFIDQFQEALELPRGYRFLSPRKKGIVNGIVYADGIRSLLDGKGE